MQVRIRQAAGYVYFVEIKKPKKWNVLQIFDTMMSAKKYIQELKELGVKGKVVYKEQI